MKNTDVILVQKVSLADKFLLIALVNTKKLPQRFHKGWK
jgi:hypothetical protein